MPGAILTLAMYERMLGLPYVESGWTELFVPASQFSTAAGVMTRRHHEFSRYINPAS